VSAFGPSILADDGEIDRKKLGDVIFSDPEKRRVLNKATHLPIFGERVRIADPLPRPPARVGAPGGASGTPGGDGSCRCSPRAPAVGGQRQPPGGVLPHPRDPIPPPPGPRSHAVAGNRVGVGHAQEHLRGRHASPL